MSKVKGKHFQSKEMISCQRELIHKTEGTYSIAVLASMVKNN